MKTVTRIRWYRNLPNREGKSVEQGCGLGGSCWGEILPSKDTISEQKDGIVMKRGRKM